MPLRFLALLLALLGTACLGTEVGNPDGKSGAGGEHGGAGGSGWGGAGGEGGAGGAGDSIVEPSPTSLDLGETCIGGVARARLDLRNHGSSTVLCEIDDREGLLTLAPSTLEIPGGATASVAAVLAVAPDDEPGERGGWIFVNWDGGASFTAVRWRASLIESDEGRTTLLCGGEASCRGLVFSGPPGGEAEVPLEVSNDGCGPVLFEGFDLGGAEGVVEIEGDDLPVELAPGDRWTGVARARLDVPASGVLRLSTDEASPPEVDWTIAIAGP